MIYVTQEQYERDVTSWENIRNTQQNMHIQNRVPTIEELRSNYLLYNIVVQLPKQEVMERRVGHG